MNISDKLKQQIKDNDLLIYMKGTPYEPRCGFSAKTVQALIECEAQFSYVDILENNDVRATLPSVSDWPTFPQVFFQGELIGGADIVTQMHESGELKKMIANSSE
ncbi:MAG: Grx4 family monothiol glutaredoxin [Gammaproteobacteria bacterium]|tara:strand:- start:414 stop:728 length:315 start_codon:yes stop_codon:yes gene_type:complete